MGYAILSPLGSLNEKDMQEPSYLLEMFQGKEKQ